jgi:hypothetical protein
MLLARRSIRVTIITSPKLGCVLPHGPRSYARSPARANSSSPKRPSLSPIEYTTRCRTSCASITTPALAGILLGGLITPTAIMRPLGAAVKVMPCGRCATLTPLAVAGVDSAGISHVPPKDLSEANSAITVAAMRPFGSDQSCADLSRTPLIWSDFGPLVASCIA